MHTTEKIEALSNIFLTKVTPSTNTNDPLYQYSVSNRRFLPISKICSHFWRIPDRLR